MGWLGLGKKSGETANKIIGTVGSAIDALTTTNEEKSNLKNQLTKTVMSELNKLSEHQKEIIISETKGNFIQRSWRPILMLTFAAVVVISCFYEVKLNNVPEKFWSLLQLGIGGYIGGRTVEKVANTATKNMDLSFLRRKDRKIKED